MDRLRSPGGCPWDAEQTHESLLPYLIEECYELYQAIEDGDRAEIREELGDVLLQVLFHARVAAEPGGRVRHRRRGRRPGREAGRPAPARVRAGRGGHCGPDQHRGTPAAPLGGAEAGREAARVQCGRCGDGAACGGAGGEAGQPDRAGRAAGRAAAERSGGGRAAVRSGRGGQARRDRPGGGAARRRPQVRRRGARRGAVRGRSRTRPASLDAVGLERALAPRPRPAARRRPPTDLDAAPGCTSGAAATVGGVLRDAARATIRRSRRPGPVAGQLLRPVRCSPAAGAACSCSPSGVVGRGAQRRCGAAAHPTRRRPGPRRCGPEHPGPATAPAGRRHRPGPLGGRDADRSACRHAPCAPTARPSWPSGRRRRTAGCRGRRWPGSAGSSPTTAGWAAPTWTRTAWPDRGSSGCRWTVRRAQRGARHRRRPPRRGPDLDRAVGPMQFLPASWARYGADGNGDGVRDPHQLDDAALAAAAYLCAGPGHGQRRRLVGRGAGLQPLRRVRPPGVGGRRPLRRRRPRP